MTMKVRGMRAFVAMAMTLTVLCAGAMNARAEGMRIATVDVQRLIVESKAGKSIQKQVIAERESMQTEIAKLEQSLQAEQAKLTEGRAKMTGDEFSQKQIEFEKKLLEARGNLQNRGRNLDKAANDALNELRGKITDIVYEMATGQGIDLVLTSQNVVAAAKSADITASVLESLDKSLPDLKLKGESAAAAASKKNTKTK